MNDYIVYPPAKAESVFVESEVDSFCCGIPATFSGSFMF